jgi:predicted Zn finger-like uncharacterized protein
MFTQCPQCQAIFPASAEEVGEAYGHVRCGRCGEVFSSLDRLCDNLSGEGQIPTRVHSDRPPTLIESRAAPDPADDLFLSQEPAPIDFEPFEYDDDAADPDEFCVTQPTPPQSRSAGWMAASLGLLILLTAQFGYAKRQNLLNDSFLRPWMDRACGLLGCRLPLRQALDQVVLVSRDIRPHTSVEGALIISATMQNRAAFFQPFPTVEITLSNLSSERIAMRLFQPADYLESNGISDQGMAPGTLLPLVFEVVDPGDDAVAFEFNFR